MKKRFLLIAFLSAVSSLNAGDNVIVAYDLNLDFQSIVEWPLDEKKLAILQNLDLEKSDSKMDLPLMWRLAISSLKDQDKSVGFVPSKGFLPTLDGEAPQKPDFTKLIFDRIEITELAYYDPESIFNPPTVEKHKYIISFRFNDHDGDYIAIVRFLHDSSVLIPTERGLKDEEKKTIKARQDHLDLHFKEIEEIEEIESKDKKLGKGE